MTPFLQRLAREIVRMPVDDPGKVCVVLPNRRAGLYLKKYLAKELQKAAWAPATYSIEDFITTISGFGMADPAGLLFEFYKVYTDNVREKAQDFEHFTDWAEVLLQDFDEIDRYMADPEKVFHYLDAARALSVWNLNAAPLTQQEQDYVEFYRSLNDLYRELRSRLTAQKQVYQGLAYRLTAENIEEIRKTLPWNKIIFAGLNALSVAEVQIIDSLVSGSHAELFWDADAYYTDNPLMEAGVFLRQHFQKWPREKQSWIGTDFRDGAKKIKVTGIPGIAGQARLAGDIIMKMKMDAEAPDHTAIVLADEKLLLPVLYTLPEDIGPVNVTMGYPFRLTQLYHLISLFFRMQETAIQLSERRRSTDKAFYVKDILKLLAHPYLQMFAPESGSDAPDFRQIADILKNRNRIFLRPGELLKFSASSGDEFRNLNELLFQFWESPSSGLRCLMALTGLIRDKVIAMDSQPYIDRDLDIEYLYHFSGILNRSIAMAEQYPFIKSVSSLKKILFSLLDKSRLPFTGEPLRGLQVMGVLETRAIDFENIVVLSVNEGILPSGRVPNSFIPFDIKTEFGLPTFKQKDAVFAYHFYRMLQRAENIHLIYDTEGDQMKGGERSRFIMQLGFELKKYNPGISFDESLEKPSSELSGNVKEIIIPKSETILERLSAKTLSGFSPTAFSLYITCPLKFYFQEVLGLAETESVEETIESKTMGTVIHQVLFQIFEPFTGKAVDAQSLTASLGAIETLTHEAFRKHYPEGDTELGKNHLILRVVLLFLRNFIKSEIEQLAATDEKKSRLEILSLEKKLEYILTCHPEGKTYNVKIKGHVDRIDRINGMTRIIDYKTGSVQARELSLKDWDQLSTDPKTGKALQLLIYGWLYLKNKTSDSTDLRVGNISLRRISAGFIPVKVPNEQGFQDDTSDQIEKQLIKLLEEILDPGVPFRQTADAANCKYCPFTSICTR